MMIEQATVIEYENGIATVQCYAKSGCGGCGAASACGTKALSALAGEKTAPRFTIKVDQELKAGDQIRLGLSENTLLKSVFLIYAVPLLVLISSALLFSHIFSHELMVLAAMLSATAVTFWSIKKIIEKNSRRADFSPVFLGRV